MSRGWESKSVESQQASQEAAQASETVPEARNSVVEIRGNIAAHAELKRRRQALELQRERILSERTSSPHRRSALATALVDIEEKLSELGWTVHL
jgi:chromosome segregation ATPase